MQFLLPLFNAYLQKVKLRQRGSDLSLAAGILRRPENFHWAHSWFITYEFCAFESIRDSRSGSGQFPCHKRLNSAISGGSITHTSCTSQLYAHPVKYLSGKAASCSSLFSEVYSGTLHVNIQTFPFGFEPCWTLWLQMWFLCVTSSPAY